MKDLMNHYMTKDQLKAELKNRAIPHLMSKADKTFAEAERYFEAVWEVDPTPASVETRLGLRTP